MSSTAKKLRAEAFVNAAKTEIQRYHKENPQIPIDAKKIYMREYQKQWEMDNPISNFENNSMQLDPPVEEPTVPVTPILEPPAQLPTREPAVASSSSAEPMSIDSASALPEEIPIASTSNALPIQTPPASGSSTPKRPLSSPAVDKKKKKAKGKGKEKEMEMDEVTLGLLANQMKMIWGEEFWAEAWELRNVVLDKEAALSVHKHVQFLMRWQARYRRWGRRGWEEFEDDHWSETAAETIRNFIMRDYAQNFEDVGREDLAHVLRKKADTIVKEWMKKAKGDKPKVSPGTGDLLLVFTNGVVYLEYQAETGRYIDVKYRSARESDPSRMFDYGYKPWDPQNDPKHAAIVKWVGEVLPDPEVRIWLLRRVAEGLFAYRKPQKMVFWIAPADSGKSTFCDLLAEVDEFDTDCAALEGGRLVVTRECEAHHVLCESKFKVMTGDPIRTREAHKAKKAGNGFKLKCINLVVTNHMPRIYNVKDAAMLKRFRCFTTPIKCTHDPKLVNRDNNIYAANSEIDNLLVEYREGMMSWLIHLYREATLSLVSSNVDFVDLWEVEPKLCVDMRNNYVRKWDVFHHCLEKHFIIDAEGEVSEPEASAVVRKFVSDNQRWCTAQRFGWKEFKVRVLRDVKDADGNPAVLWLTSHMFDDAKGVRDEYGQKGFSGIKLANPGAVQRTKRKPRAGNTGE
ncbi:hypothetical protein HK097_001642 [Rhizophlyctis rosea]|uniref:SF3 helicase domain-containing protein n=1 Tax=Rhizophlyctis rosea TaxID=64517 RepID=A0AAD5WYU3_9FUNG|nr:hypothetical protein HK097_001642 [Rhizophlyctis rosea]